MAENNNCPHCQKGKENEYGDVWFKAFDCKLTGCMYHDGPKITKRNNRYFLYVENFKLLEIKACPICGRSLVGEKHE